MATETKINLIICIVSFILGNICLLSAIAYSAWWHLFFSSMFYIITIMIYNDNSYCIESVKHYVGKKIKTHHHGTNRFIRIKKHL